MPWTNYHNHCKYCDGVGELEEHVQEAIRQNIRSLGFTSHSPVPFDTPWSMKEADFDGYLRDLEAVKSKFSDRIEIYKGLEVDFLEKWPGQIKSWTDRAKLDFTVGSVHFVKEFEDGKPWEIDGTLEVFQRGIREIFGGDLRKAVSSYFELTCQMLEKDTPTILGHLDKIKMHNSKYPFFDENDQWYQTKLKETLEVAKKSGVIVEVNTRGIYKKRTTEPYPGIIGLRAIKELNIPVCLNSDAHHPSEITSEYRDIARLLLSIGYPELMILHDGSWTPRPFSDQGLVRN
jgi:histidinol-phosphatase (PHP family)